MKTATILSAAAIAAIAGRALGQPVIDGVRDNAFYGTTPLWTQNQPTSFGDNSVTTCDPTNVGNPGAVTTGVELAIPLSALGNPSPANIKIAGFVNGSGHDFLSNQAVGGKPSNVGNLGEPRTASFAAVAGNQFVSGITTSASAPIMNGMLDPAYGAAKFTQTVRTGFGDASSGTPGTCNGSEIDALYAVVSGGTLYVLVTGNLESNFNKLELFFDVDGTVGQNTILATNPAVSNGALTRMGANSDPNAGAVGPGLTFDSGFTADYYIDVTGGDSGSGYALFVDYARLSGVPTAADPGIGYFAGQGTPQSNGTLTGADPGAPTLLATIDNSNIAGVPATCPPPAGNPDIANGSEIDGLYGRIYNGKLYLLLTGNLQTSYNKISLFIDVQSGGQNRLRANNVDIDFNGLNRMGDDGSGNGLIWDTAFSPDYWIGFTNGLDGQNNAQVFCDAAVLRTDGRLVNAGGFALDYGSYDGGPKSQFNPITFSGPRIDAQTGFSPSIYANYAPRTAGASVVANPTAPVGTPALIRASINNANLGGVTGVDTNDPNATGSVVNAGAVTTGLELEISLPELTDTCTGQCTSITSVKVGGFISSGGYDFVSNQVIGGLPNTTGRAYAVNVGDPRLVDFSQVAGNQYVTVTAGSSCYANCDGSTAVPFLNISDFVCFQSAFASGSSYANCDHSTSPPVLNISDFVCFQSAFAAGCSAP